MPGAAYRRSAQRQGARPPFLRLMPAMAAVYSYTVIEQAENVGGAAVKNGGRRSLFARNSRVTTPHSG